MNIYENSKYEQLGFLDENNIMLIKYNLYSYYMIAVTWSFKCQNFTLRMRSTIACRPNPTI